LYQLLQESAHLQKEIVDDVLDLSKINHHTSGAHVFSTYRKKKLQLYFQSLITASFGKFIVYFRVG